MTQTARSANASQWASPGAVQISRTDDLPLETYNTVHMTPCSDQDFSWRSWFGRVVTTKYSQCAIALQDAYFEDSSAVPGRIRSLLGDRTFGIDFPTLSHVRAFPVPGTNTVVVNSWAYQNSFSKPSGLHIIRDYHTTLTDNIYDSAGNKTIRPSKPFDFELRDASGELVSIRQNGLKFSTNGKWMIFRLSHGGKSAWARINLDTYEVLAFATPTQDTFSVQDAISNDGRYVILYEPQSDLRIYDLASCSDGPDKLLSQQCSYIDVMSKIKDTLGVSDIQFKNFVFHGDQNISAYIASKKPGSSTWSYGEYTLSYGAESTSNGYLAMGDSFSSGEGAYDYRSETNFYKSEGEYNLCHQSKSSYPYVLSKAIGFEWFGSVACSGAKTKDIDFGSANDQKYQMEDPQAKDLSNRDYNDVIYGGLFPGYREQKKFLTESAESPGLATVSIGGNDIGFGDIVAACVSPLYIQVTCYQSRDQREQLADLIDTLIPSLVTTYEQIKESAVSPSFRLYVVGYPQIVRPEGECGANVGMDHYEGEFARSLVDYLNDAIRVAATRAGARYVDVSNAFIKDERDYRLCGNQANLAVNGLVLRGKTSKKPGRLEYQESYHPNLLGHALLASAINQETQSLTQNVPPEPPSTLVIKQDASLRRAFVGDEQRLISTQKLGYDDNLVQGLVTRGEPLQYRSSNTWPVAEPNSKAVIELHSTPVKLGEVAFDAQGKVAGSIVLPTDVEPGYHELHVKYNDFFGESVDRYQIIFVRASNDDYDGDGVPNDVDPCITGRQSGVDSDEDGIDDACDGEYAKVASTQGTDSSTSEEAAQIIQDIPRLAAQSTTVSRNEEQSTTEDNTQPAKIETREEVLSSADRRAIPPKTDAAKISADDTITKLPDWPIMVGALLAISVAFLLVSKLLARRLS